jgi:Flp pilus assembly protein TadD
MLTAGCATSNHNGARWLQRGEAEQLLAAQSAIAEADPDPDKMPADASALEAQGDAMASQGAVWSAMNQYRLALRTAQGKAKVRLQGKIAGLDLRLGRFEVARDGFAKLTAAHPQQAVFWQGLGLAEMGRNDIAAAQKALTKAVRLDPSLWRAQNLLGVIHNRNQRPKQAQRAFRAALQARPGNPALYNNLALSQMMLDDYTGAEASLRRALALNPEHRLAANNLGLLLMRQGRREEAFQVFAQAVGVAQAHNNLGVILAWQGQPRQAQAQFQLAMQSLPRYYPLAARHLSQVGDQPDPSASRLGARPMVPLALRLQSKPLAATARATASTRDKPKGKLAAKPKARNAPKAQPKAAPEPKPDPDPLLRAKPAPQSKPQRIAQDAAPTKAGPARQAPKGLWMRADGTMAYGPAPAGSRTYGVVFGASPKD